MLPGIFQAIGIATVFLSLIFGVILLIVRIGERLDEIERLRREISELRRAIQGEAVNNRMAIERISAIEERINKGD